VTAKKTKAAPKSYPPVRPTPTGLRATERLRKLCLALPGATEKVSHGEVTWFAKKVFVMMSDHHHDDRLAFTCPAPEGAQEVLVATQPHKFYRPPYVGHLGWLGIYLDVPETDWNEIADLVVQAYRQVAPRQLIAQLDAETPRSAVKSRSGRGRTRAPSR
jgi:predicted DNA-binding protein (MmcQ/YjbR family)